MPAPPRPLSLKLPSLRPSPISLHCTSLRLSLQDLALACIISKEHPSQGCRSLSQAHSGHLFKHANVLCVRGGLKSRVFLNCSSLHEANPHLDLPVRQLLVLETPSLPPRLVHANPAFTRVPGNLTQPTCTASADPLSLLNRRYVQVALLCWRTVTVHTGEKTP